MSLVPAVVAGKIIAAHAAVLAALPAADVPSVNPTAPPGSVSQNVDKFLNWAGYVVGALGVMMLLATGISFMTSHRRGEGLGEGMGKLGGVGAGLMVAGAASALAGAVFV